MTDTLTIRRRNDAFRRSPGGGRGQWLLTSGIASLPSEDRASVLAKVMGFDAFSKDNDPHGEHDFGAFDHAGQRIFWKIDYYDASMKFGAEDPADEARTQRVLTIMLASEY